MNWKFWKREVSKPEPIIETHVIPFSTLYRWYCYDTAVEELDKIDTVMGVIPISDEAKVMEEDASDERLEAIEALYPFFETMSQINSMVITETQFREAMKVIGVDEEEGAEQAIEFMERLAAYASFSGISAAFSSAKALGLIEIPKSSISEVGYEQR